MSEKEKQTNECNTNKRQINENQNEVVNQKQVRLVGSCQGLFTLATIKPHSIQYEWVICIEYWPISY